MPARAGVSRKDIHDDEIAVLGSVLAPGRRRIDRGVGQLFLLMKVGPGFPFFDLIKWTRVVSYCSYKRDPLHAKNTGGLRLSCNEDCFAQWLTGTS